ncbi:MAG: hypothetical protein RLZZ546_2162 [Bacteroidota bacterium]|jgi:hypothetical protein
MQIKHYKEKVTEILKENEQARNDDWVMIATYIENYTDFGRNGVMILSDMTQKKLPPLNSLRIARQIIQNVDGEYLPTDPEVIKQRKIKERNIREAEYREAKIKLEDIYN